MKGVVQRDCKFVAGCSPLWLDCPKEKSDTRLTTSDAAWSFYMRLARHELPVRSGYA
jgi:hypothetical protein